MTSPSPLKVNRAPVLTLWAAVVAERLDHAPDTALTLGRFVAGSSARAKATRLGIQEETKGKEPHAVTKPNAHHPVVHLLGRDIPVVKSKDGAPLAEQDGKPTSARSVQSYLSRAFGERLPEVRKAMDALARSLPPEELNRVGFRLYEHFRPEVPEGVKGWGAKGELRLERIRDAAD